MIKAAGIDDVDGVVELARRMHGESIYRSIGFNAEKFAGVIREHIDTGCVFVAHRSEVLIGALVGGVCEHLFSNELFGYELGVFVTPECRGGTTAIRLLKAFELWCVEMGAVNIDMGITTGIHTENTGKLYQKLGFIECGKHYRKEIRNV